MSFPANHPHGTGECKGLARIRAAKPAVKALREGHIKAMLACCAQTPIGGRDATIIAPGFATVLCHSEICGLTIDDLEIMDDEERQRMFLHIRKPKTDQQAQGHKIAVPEGENIQAIAFQMISKYKTTC